MVTKTDLLTLMAKYKQAEERDLYYTELLQSDKTSGYQFKQNLKNQTYWYKKREALRKQLKEMGSIPEPVVTVRYKWLNTKHNKLYNPIEEYQYYGVEKEAVEILFKLQFPNRALVEIL